MMRAWPTKPIGELCQLINGRAFKPSDWGKDGLPIVRIQNLNDQRKPFNKYNGNFSEKHFIDNGAILLSWSGTPGTSFGCFRWLRGPGILNQHIFKVIIQDNILDGDFFIYAVNSRLDEMISQAHGGVGLRHITKAKLDAIHLPVPKLEEQHRIVARIKECMERVEEIKDLRNNAIKDSKFLPSSVFADYIESFDRSKVGDNIIGDVVVDCKYGSSIKANSAKKGFPVLRMGNIQGGRIDTADLKHIEMPKKEQRKYALQEGDILINRTNSLELVGKSAVFKGLSGDWIFASYLIRIRVNKDKALPEYVNAVINSRIGRGYVYRTARRAIGMVNINAKEIQRMPLPLPSIAVQTELIEKINEVEPLVDELTAHFQEDGIAHLRESILRKAFAGEL